MNPKLLKSHNENIKKKDTWGMEEWAFTLKLEERLGMKIKTDIHPKTV